MKKYILVLEKSFDVFEFVDSIKKYKYDKTKSLTTNSSILLNGDKVIIGIKDSDIRAKYIINVDDIIGNDVIISKVLEISSNLILDTIYPTDVYTEITEEQYNDFLKCMLNSILSLDDDEEKIKKEFQDWLVTKDNPEYSGTEKYAKYGYCLARLIKKGEELGHLSINSLTQLSLENIDQIISKYPEMTDLVAWDKDKNQKQAGIAALKKFKLFLEWKKNGKKVFNFICGNKDGDNKVVYGTPGCGKSYFVEHFLLKKYRHDDQGLCIDSIRTTFFQDYTNTDFVGQIMPVVDGDKVDYKFIPGPFTLALDKAIKNPDLPIALVIEELNRGNAASIFGDLFQLLDRKEGTSVYNITNVNIQKYLEEKNPSFKFEYIKIPSNLSIFATMNTSDQNVFTLDTAFKRRWKFEKIKNSFEDLILSDGTIIEHPYKKYNIPGIDLEWQEFCNSINDFILSSDQFVNSEDKQLGVYFVDKEGLREKKMDVSSPEKRKEFAYKVFEYLWDDVAKYDRKQWFGDVKSLDELIDNYVKASQYEKDADSASKDGRTVFSKDVFKKAE